MAKSASAILDGPSAPVSTPAWEPTSRNEQANDLPLTMTVEGCVCLVRGKKTWAYDAKTRGSVSPRHQRHKQAEHHRKLLPRPLMSGRGAPVLESAVWKL